MIRQEMHRYIRSLMPIGNIEASSLVQGFTTDYNRFYPGGITDQTSHLSTGLKKSLLGYLKAYAYYRQSGRMTDYTRAPLLFSRHINRRIREIDRTRSAALATAKAHAASRKKGRGKTNREHTR
jgi:hypothetical protein